MRASTQEQDAERARDLIIETVAQHGKSVDRWHIENESGAKLDRPQLWAMLDNCEAGDVVAIESVDRISRLSLDEWETLSGHIKGKGVRLFICDLPTSHISLAQGDENEFTRGMLNAVNNMLVDMAATMARKDYTMRRERQAQGIAKAKAAGKYQGKQADPETLENFTKARDMVATGVPVLRACKAYGISRDTYYRLAKENAA